MDKTIMIGCDLHEQNMLLKIAVGRGEPETRLWRNTRAGRWALREDLARRAAALGGTEVVFA